MKSGFWATFVRDVKLYAMACILALVLFLVYAAAYRVWMGPPA